MQLAFGLNLWVRLDICNPNAQQSLHVSSSNQVYIHGAYEFREWNWAMGFTYIKSELFKINALTVLDVTSSFTLIRVGHTVRSAFD